MATSTSTIQISAPVEKVWEALTRPDLVRRWQYGSELQTDWEPGSPIRFRTEWDGQVFEQWGTVLEVRENRAVTYDLFAPRPGLEDRPENYFVMSCLLEPVQGGTRLSIVQQDDRPGADAAGAGGDDDSGVLAGLKSLVESLVR